MSNMDLWNKVCKTNPSDTKAVNFGRKITAIDPYSQIENATRQFGPLGIGWGYTAGQVQYTPTDMVAVEVVMWIETPEKTFSHWGQNSLYMDKNKTKQDDDCFKKAMTDGVTKCLSFLGFNNDVFRGKFDDNKYVQQRAQEEQNKPDEEWKGPLNKTTLKQKMRDLSNEMNDCEDMAQVDGMLEEYKDALLQCEADLPDWYDGFNKAYNKRKKELGE